MLGATMKAIFFVDFLGNNFFSFYSSSFGQNNRAEYFWKFLNSLQLIYQLSLM